EVNLGTTRHVGQRGVLATAIVAGRGSVKLGDTVWPVTGPDMPAGTTVTVTGTDGVTLTVAAELEGSRGDAETRGGGCGGPRPRGPRPPRPRGTAVLSATADGSRCASPPGSQRARRRG